jgi:hypothetical protein
MLTRHAPLVQRSQLVDQWQAYGGAGSLGPEALAQQLASLVDCGELCGEEQMVEQVGQPT